MKHLYSIALIGIFILPIKYSFCSITTDSTGIVKEDFPDFNSRESWNWGNSTHKTFFGKILSWVGSLVSNGSYTEGNNRVNFPYTTFSKEYNRIQRDSVINNIRLKKFEYHIFYKRLFFLASTSVSTSSVTKAAAFVYLMGIDTAGNELDNNSLNWFRLKAENAIASLRKSTLDYDYIIVNSSFTFEGQQHRAEELVEYLQAYDYLRYGHETFYETVFENEREIRKVLHDFTYQLYSSANNMFGSLRRYNNLSIMVASAVGMAAIVLHDNETPFWRVQNKPKRWAQAAHAYINLSMFKINTDGNAKSLNTEGPNCQKGSKVGYAEGPGYFQYCFKLAIPFFRSFDNFVGGRNGEFGTPMHWAYASTIPS